MNAEIRETVADLCHEQWSHWVRYMLSQGEVQPDGTWVMPADKLERWTRQMETPYSDLSESEQDSDRREADKFLAVLGA